MLSANALQTIVFLSDTYPGRIHDKRIAAAMPYALPVGSELLQDLGFMGFTLEGLRITQPIKKTHGKALTRAQKAANEKLARRHAVIEHVIGSLNRCWLVKDTLRPWKPGVADQVREVCCVVRSLRLRLAL
jgi:hypothetical protein